MRKLRRCGKGTEAYQGGEPDIVESVQLLDNPDERVLNTLVENIPVAIQFLDKDGKIFKYNKGYEDLFGINHKAPCFQITY